MSTKLKISIVVLLVIASAFFFDTYSVNQANAVPVTNIAATSTPSATTSPTKIKTLDTTVTTQVATTTSTSTSATKPSNFSLTVGSSTYPLEITPGETVLEVMQALSSRTTFTFAGKTDPSMGMFVTTINGVSNNHGSYWFLYINGESASKGISTQALSSGDHVEWKLESGY